MSGSDAILARLMQLHPKVIDLSLDRMQRILAALGNPERRIPPAIHIAGTNGKGSTAAYCASLLGQLARALQRAGGPHLRLGLYTSPHLQRVRERIQLGDDATAGIRECTEDEFVGALSAVQAAAQAAPAVTLTFFEALTAAAFVLWREAGVDLAVVETGLGGRLDATRLCLAQVTVVTSIDLDHVELLGPTRADIAREKAGIFRPGVPALAACLHPEARAVLVAEAQRLGAPLRLYEPDSWTGAPRPSIDPLPAILPLDSELAAAVPLAGEHQLRNAALAVTAVQLFLRPGSELKLASGVELARLHALAHDRGLLRAGLAATRWPGRLERLWPPPDAASEPPPIALPPGVAVFIDAAHNPEGVQALALWLAAELGGRPLTILFGAVAGKQVDQMAAPLRRAGQVVLTRAPSPRGLAAADLAAQLVPELARAAAASVHVVPDWLPALHAAVSRTAPGGVLLVYGSIFLIAAVRGFFFREEVDELQVQDPGRPPERQL